MSFVYSLDDNRTSSLSVVEKVECHVPISYHWYRLVCDDVTPSALLEVRTTELDDVTSTTPMDMGGAWNSKWIASKLVSKQDLSLIWTIWRVLDFKTSRTLSYSAIHVCPNLASVSRVGFYRMWFLPRCMHCMHARGLATRKLSVCPSVKRMHCDKTAEISVQIFIPYQRSFYPRLLRKKMFDSGDHF